MNSEPNPYRLGAEFWGQFVPENKRTEFVNYLAELWEQNPCVLYCDYDPDENLCGALEHVGIECRGFMFSAKDVGFPNKTGTHVLKGVCHVKQGYGGLWVVLSPNEIQ